jgi:hypothetical protein
MDLIQPLEGRLIKRSDIHFIRLSTRVFTTVATDSVYHCAVIHITMLTLNLYSVV